MEIMLAIDETAIYAFTESGCLCKDKKTSDEKGDNNARSVTTRGVTRYLKSLRSSLPLTSQKLTITSKNSEIQNGTARYHPGSIFLASDKKSTEPKKEIVLIISEPSLTKPVSPFC
ncbi:hypothetical protein ACSAZL_09615 [Methanosarcina sp. T3]|uniref:hypothetical protein n=1 Tax=Methanosarcina sp. T3 TaxID=3439062 RepID=UPI003F855D3D